MIISVQRQGRVHPQQVQVNHDLTIGESIDIDGTKHVADWKDEVGVVYLKQVECACGNSFEEHRRFVIGEKFLCRHCAIVTDADAVEKVEGPPVFDFPTERESKYTERRFHQLHQQLFPA